MESQRGVTVSREKSCSCPSLHWAMLGFTAGGSGRASSVAITSNAPRIQIVCEIDFTYSCAP